MTTTAPFTFTFTVAPLARGFFAHRGPATWLDDLYRFTTKGDAVFTDHEGGLVEVTGDEDALRFACVALNLHAEQTPWDSTPVEQGEALERVLAGTPVADDTAVVEALRAAGLEAAQAYTPSRVEITHGTCVIYATTHFNRDDLGWEAVYDAGGDQTGLDDGPGVNATTAEVVEWLTALHAKCGPIGSDGEAL